MVLNTSQTVICPWREPVSPFSTLLPFALTHRVGDLYPTEICVHSWNTSHLNGATMSEKPKTRLPWSRSGFHPDCFSSYFPHQDSLPIHFKASFAYFIQSIFEHRPSAFDNVVRALRRLLEVQEHFEALERRMLRWQLNEETRSAIESMFKLVRQADKS